MGIGIFRHAEEFESYAAGQTIFTQGDPCGQMYVVQEGEVDMVVGEKVVETVGPNGIFGEMALVDNQPRSASAIARTDCRVVPLTEEKFMAHVHRTPFFSLQVMRVLVRRIRQMNEQAGTTQQ